MSKRETRGALTPNSVPVLVLIGAALIQEIAALILGARGGAFSHVIWWALGDPWTWRWALVGAPIIGLLVWCVPHFLFGWGQGTALLVIMAGVFVMLAAAVLLVGH